MGVLGVGQYTQFPEMVQYFCIVIVVLLFLLFLSQIYPEQRGLMLSMSHSMRCYLLVLGWRQSFINIQMVCISQRRFEEMNGGKAYLINIQQIYLISCCSFDEEELIYDFIVFEYYNNTMFIRKILEFSGRVIGGNRGRQYVNHFNFGEEKSDYGVRFDQEKIKEKMKEIKERRFTGKVKKQQKLQFMNFDQQSESIKKVRRYRQATKTQNLLHFSDPSLQEKPTQWSLQITGFDENCIQVDNMVYPPAMIIFPKQVLVWEVLSIETLKIQDFILLKYITPKPSYVVVGVNEPEKFPKKIYEELRSQFDNFDVLQMFQATSQFNVTANDDINVVAFLLTK